MGSSRRGWQPLQRCGRHGRARVRAAAMLTALALLVTACGGAPAPAERVAGGDGEAPVILRVNKSPTCECCAGHVAHLQESGFIVQTVLSDDVGALKDELGVPADSRSCHTTTGAGYFFEGHLPAEAIRRVLDERPAIDGIALPGMPPGSPGMGGEQTAPFAVEAVTDGLAEPYASF
jgi:hypothetical protein